jgi:predicted N-formylglutamate amidohydrolase
MNAANRESPSRLLSPGDPKPLIVQNAGGSSSHVLVCDHSGRGIPARLGALGLDPADLDRHIAWDIGAGALALRTGEALDACVVRQAYSRLVVDCNRWPGREDLIPAVSDGTRIPANVGLSPADVQERLAAIHAPYHAGISAVLDARHAEQRPVTLISVHSFTRVMNDRPRPWRLGVLHADDSPLSRRMLALLKAEGLEVGDNQPYALGETDYTVPVHAQARGLDYLELEVRQDLIADAAGQARMAALLARLLQA